MSLQDLGALGEVIGGFAVVISLVYVAYQIRQSSHQIELNSRHIQASMYHATNDNFFRWFMLLAQDEEVAGLWRRALQGEHLSGPDRLRCNALASMLFLSWEVNFEQLRLGTVQRSSFQIGAPDIARILASPALQAWWAGPAATMLTPEFRAAIDALIEAERRSPPTG